MKKFFGILFFAYMAYLVFTTSCANKGMPSGGDKDSIPPVILSTEPETNARNYKGKTVSLTFDEYVITDQVSEALVVSPPLEKKPTVRSKSKTVTITLGDSLRENVTYSLDFKDAIADNNEKNQLKDFRFAFSTGPDFDTLMIGGYVLAAENIEPAKGVTVLLYHVTDSLSGFRTHIPDYISKTNDEGFYAFSNVAEGKYHLYALEDADNSMTFNQPGEKIAFLDSFAVPDNPVMTGTVDLDSTAIRMLIDSLQQDSLPVSPELLSARKEVRSVLADSIDATLPELVIPGGVDVDPNRPGRQAGTTRMHPYYLLLFEEENKDQYLNKYTRDQNNLLKFYFDNAVTDTFRIDLLSPQPVHTDWYLPEFNPAKDSISIWITDTLVSNTDTLKFRLAYEVLDSLKNPVTKQDSLQLIYQKPSEPRKRKREKEEDVPKVEPFTFQTNAVDKFDSYNPLTIITPEPLAEFDHSQIRLFQIQDSVETGIPVTLLQDSALKRKYLIRHPWVFEGHYRLEIDSAAAKTYSGKPSFGVDQKFSIQEESYYGKITFDMFHVPGPCILQLLKNSDKEEVLKEIRFNTDGVVEIPFIKPEKYKFRLIVDRNDNGRWDTGNLDERRQPERVLYYSKILKIKSNFQIRESWHLPDDIQQKKELIDDDKGAKDSKKGKSANKRSEGSRF